MVGTNIFNGIVQKLVDGSVAIKQLHGALVLSILFKTAYKLNALYLQIIMKIAQKHIIFCVKFWNPGLHDNTTMLV